MNKRLLFTAIALGASAFANAGVIPTFDAANFNAPTVEHFSGGPVVPQSTYDFGNGMTYANLAGQSDWITHIGNVVLGAAGSTDGRLRFFCDGQ